MLRQTLRLLSFEQTAPESIALSIALGLTLGVFPVYGCPTLLCLGAVALVRPHAALLQAINAATSPLQFALILPFRAVGAFVFPAAAKGGTAAAACGFAAQTIVGWSLICVPFGLALYLVVVRLLRRRMAHRIAA